MESKMKTFDLMFLLICNMAGIGVFRLAHYVLSQTKSCVASLLLIVVSGAIATVFGLCYAELGATYPQAGGDLNYLGKAFSKHLGTVYSLVSITAILPLSCAVMSITIAECFQSEISQDVCIAVLLAICSVFLAFGGRLVTWAVRTLFLSKIVTVAFLLVTSLLSFTVARKAVPAINDPRSSMSEIDGMAPIIHGLCFTQFSFDGWNCGNYIANRIKCPGKAFPRAIVGSIWCVVAIYILINLSFMWVVPYDTIVGNKFFMDEYFDIIGIPIPSRILSVAVTLAPALGSLICSFTVGSGILESLLPVKFTKTIELGCFALFSLVVFLFTQSSHVLNMVGKIAFGISLFYSLSCLGLFVLKRRHPSIERPFSVPAVLPLVASAMGALICSYIIKATFF